MITVLQVIDTGGPGGAETIFLHTATKLDPRRFRTISLVSRDGWLADQLRAQGDVPLIRDAAGSFKLRYLWHMTRLVREMQVDVIVAHLFGSAVYAGLASLATGVPAIAILHGQSDINDIGRLAMLKRLFVRRLPQRIVFVSDVLRARLSGALMLPRGKCVVIPNGVDVDRFRPRDRGTLRNSLGIPADSILVGAVGNIRRPKGYEVLLHAAHSLHAQSSRYHFVVVGEGSGSLYKDLLRLRSQLGLNDVFHFLGMRDDVAALLPAFDIFALSSHTEGFSIACVEAMACGVPVVGTRCGGPEEIVEHEISGLLVPANDSAALAGAIHRVAMDDGLAGQLARHGLVRAHSRFTLSTMLTSYEKLLQEAASKSRLWLRKKSSAVGF
jgi:glycosyltransferase involved in cell wall biosynthesis